MSKLRLSREAARAEETGSSNPYRFPVEAARRLGAEAGERRSGRSQGGAATVEGEDMITQIEAALDRMQHRLDDLSDQIGSFRFPGAAKEEDAEPDPGPSAA